MAVKKIGEILIENGFIAAQSVHDALIISKKEGIRFGEACIRLGLVDEKRFFSAIAEQYGLEAVDLKDASVDEEVMGIIPAEVLYSARIAPVKNNGVSLIAISDPTDVHTLDNIERMIEEKGMMPGKVVVAPGNVIEKLLNRGSTAARILKDASGSFPIEVLRESEEQEEALTIEKIAGDTSPVVKLVDTVIYDAISKNASDIHLETGAGGLAVKYRIDGVLHSVMEPVDKRFQASIISRIKVMSELDISERRKPQDGRFKTRLKNKTIDFRVSIMPSIHGEDAVIRVLDKEHLTRDFEGIRLDSLGFGEKDVAHLRRMIREPYGMFLVTGPTGSGKTTTLYAAISEINTGEDKIVTIEDPVEYELKGVIQIPVNEKKGLTFATGLRSILRHDPDKIMVGEIRDAETAQIAIQAALTGHLVFTTVHANNVFDVIGRFIHMGIEPYNVVASLNCVLAQRLIRLVCNRCRKPVSIDKKFLIESGLNPDEYAGVEFYEGAGCSECHDTGYKGRKAIVELLDLSDEIKDMIASKQPVSAIKKRSLEEGMVTLRKAALKCLKAGETTLKEINRVTFVEKG